MQKEQKNQAIFTFRVFKKFRNLAPELIPMEMTTGEAVKIKIPKDRIVRLQELVENP